MIEKKHVDGANKGDILIYTLSTCGWCKKTKAYLAEAGVAFDYIDVDLLEHEDAQEVMKKVKEFNYHGSFPTIVINESESIIGYDADRLKELLNESGEK
jgi:glutaredoxin-like protein NrdH